jgi:hypothetical protein
LSDDSFVVAIEAGIRRVWSEDELAERRREIECAEAIVAFGAQVVVHDKIREKRKDCHGWIDKESHHNHDRRNCHCYCAARILMGFKNTAEEEKLRTKYKKWFPELQSRTPLPRQLTETQASSPFSSNDEVLEYMVKVGVCPEPSVMQSEELDSLASPISSVYTLDISPTEEWPQSPASTHELPRSPSADLALSPLKEIPPPLDQIQYRTYKHPITLYHYNMRLLPIRTFLNKLTKPEHGYVHSLISHDAISDLVIEDGDKTPESCIEAVYVPNVFHKGSRGPGVGCAIGLRYRGEEGMQVEWLCFQGPVRELVEECKNERGELVCNRVGEVEKMCKQGCKGEGEHRNWWRSLEKGVVKAVRLKLVLKEKKERGVGKGVMGDMVEDSGLTEGKSDARIEPVKKKRKTKRDSWPTPPLEKSNWEALGEGSF